MPGPAALATVNLKTLAQLKGVQELIEGIKAVIETTADFEQQMSRVSAVSQAAGEDLGKLSAKARDLGSTTVLTATEAGKGMEELARLGFDVEEIYSSVQATLNLAVSSALGLGRAAEITAGALSAFNLEASEASRITDTLALTAANTGANVDSIGESLATAGAIASTAGLSFEEMSAFIGVLGDRMVRGSAAGTNFRQFIVGIATETPKGAAALDKLQLSYEDIDVTTRGLGPVLETLNVAFSALGTRQERIAVAADIWGRRQFNAALIAIDSVDKFNSLIDTYDRGAGAAQNMADVMSDNLAGSFKFLNSAMEEVRLTVGEQMSPALRSLLELLTEMARGFSEAGGGAETLGKILSTIVESINILINSAQATPEAFSIIFNTILIEAREFEIELLGRFESIAEAFGRDDLAEKFSKRADDLRVALGENRQALEDAKIGIADNLLNINDAFERSIERWKDSTKQISDIKVDLGPLESSIKQALDGIRDVVASSGEDVGAEIEALRGVLDFKKIFEGVETEALTEEQVEGLRSRIDLLIALFEKGGVELDSSVLEFRASLDSIGTAVKDSANKTEESADQLGGALNRVGTIVTQSGGVIKAGADSIKTALAGIVGFDKDKILENAAAIEGALQRIASSSIALDPDQRENLRAQIEGIVEDFSKLKEDVPPLIKEAAESFNIYVESFGSIQQAADSAEGSVTGAIDGINKSVGGTAESVNELGATFSVMGERVAVAANRTTELVREIDEVTDVAKLKIVQNTKDIGKGVEDLGESFVKAGGKSAEFKESQDQVVDSTSKGRQEITGVSDAAELASVNLEKAATSTDNMATSGANLAGSLSSGVESLREVSDIATTVSDKFNTLSNVEITPVINTGSIQAVIALVDEALFKFELLESKA